MLIPVTIVLTQNVYEIEIFDLRGSDKPLYKRKGHTKGDELNLGSVISDDDCSPPEGYLEIEARMAGPGDAWRAYPIFRVVAGKNEWQPAAAPPKVRKRGKAGAAGQAGTDSQPSS
jgi:hypothetical protein